MFMPASPGNSIDHKAAYKIFVGASSRRDVLDQGLGTKDERIWSGYFLYLSSLVPSLSSFIFPLKLAPGRRSYEIIAHSTFFPEKCIIQA